MKVQGCVKLFVLSVLSASLSSLSGRSIRPYQDRDLAFRYLHCKGSLFCSSGRTTPRLSRRARNGFLQKTSG